MTFPRGYVTLTITNCRNLFPCEPVHPAGVRPSRRPGGGVVFCRRGPLQAPPRHGHICFLEVHRERSHLRCAAAGGTLVYAPHRTAPGGGSAAGNWQLLHQSHHAGGLRPHRLHPPRQPAVHCAGHHEPVRQRHLRQPAPAVCHGRGHRHGAPGKGGGRPVRRHRLSGDEHRHQRHDPRRGRRTGHG